MLDFTESCANDLDCENNLMCYQNLWFAENQNNSACTCHRYYGWRGDSCDVLGAGSVADYTNTWTG
eukprot:snap_masked-scaffold_3-processed-gene-6.35-mRNA-1 protein AED:1.00 eAED:1.00 QI:0/0/0/0/1/1/3/0/65